MVYGRDDVELELAVCGGLENACIDLNLLDTGSIELFERCDDACLLACARRTVDEEVWKVAALCLYNVALVAFRLLDDFDGVLTRARRRSESSG